ncbi:hypothetical protein [Ruegeria atlantica]|uniref:hypothetical protein n=1 Tax=Ruegeria atlantica TaxID=81569 RepID=UPI001C2C9990|nr:hypothetical protein [Ruegeria atlantica]
MYLHTFRIGKGVSQFEERNVRVLPHQLLEDGPMWGQLACIARGLEAQVPSDLRS